QFGLWRATGKQTAPHGAVLVRFLQYAALANPIMELVTVEEIIRAVDQRCRGSVFEFQEGNAISLRWASRIENTDIGADAAHLVPSDESDDFDLMGHLIKKDSAALRGV